MAHDEGIQWHPAFFQAIRIELKDYKHILTFEAEHQLTSEPLRMDTLIIKKPPDARIDKNIGQMFRQCNIVEYKSPGDNLTIEDYNKVFGYAYLYAALEKISINDVTVTFVETAHPRKLLKYLRNERELNAKEVFDGIYYVSGESMPVQIIESKKLSENENLWLKALTRELKPATAIRVFEEKKKSDEELNTYIYAIVKANLEVIEEVRKMKSVALEDALAEMGFFEQSYVDKIRSEAWSEAWSGAWNEAWNEAWNKGTQQNTLELAREMFNEGVSIEKISKVTKLSIDTLKEVLNLETES